MSFKALHIKHVTCLEQSVLCTFSAASHSVSSSLEILFRCAHNKLDINGIVSYRITYKNINISYKLDIPPSPTTNIPVLHKTAFVHTRVYIHSRYNSINNFNYSVFVVSFVNKYTSFRLNPIFHDCLKMTEDATIISIKK